MGGEGHVQGSASKASAAEAGVADDSHLQRVLRVRLRTPPDTTVAHIATLAAHMRPCPLLPADTAQAVQAVLGAVGPPAAGAAFPAGGTGGPGACLGFRLLLGPLLPLGGLGRRLAGWLLRPLGGRLLPAPGGVGKVLVWGAQIS